MLRWLTAGESHGPALVATIEGLPAGVEVTTDDVAAALARRRLGYGRGARMKFEQDEVEFLGGVRHGLHPGVAGRRPHRQHRVAEVGDVMSPDPVDADALAAPTTSTPRRSRPQPAAHPPATRATPTSSACRSTASTTPARCSSGPAPARPRPGSRSARSRRAFLEQAYGIRLVSHTVAIGPAAVADDAPLPDRRRRRRARRRPGARFDPAASARDGRRGRRGPQGRRHPRRRRRGARLRAAAGPRLARALGPPARRPARRRAHGHPGDQGRRGRRRLPHRRPPRLAGPRRDGARRRRRHPPAHRPRGRHRGRHVDRQRAARPRRDEADLHRARAPSTRSTSRPARPRRAHPPALRRLRRARRPASSPRRWSRSCSPRPCSRSSAATRWPRRRATTRRTSTPSRRRCAPGDASHGAAVVLVGPPGSGKTHRRPAPGRAARRPVRTTPTHAVEAAAGHSRSPTSSSTTASRPSATLERAEVAARPGRARRRRRARRRSADGPDDRAAALAGHTVVVPRRRHRRRVAAGRVRPAAGPLLARQPARAAGCADERAPPALRAGRHRHGSTPRAARPRTSSAESPALRSEPRRTGGRGVTGATASPSGDAVRRRRRAPACSTALAGLLGDGARKVLVVHPPALAATRRRPCARRSSAQGFEALLAEVPDAEAAKTRRRSRPCCWSVARAGRLHPLGCRRRRRRRRRHRPRRLRRRHLAARRARWCTCRRPCSAMVDAAVGRQDRHQHRRGQEPRRARSTRRPACSATSTTLATLPRARPRGRAGRGRQVRVHRRPGDPRPRRGRPGRRDRPATARRCASSSSGRSGSRPTSSPQDLARRACARSSTTATPSATRSSRPSATAGGTARRSPSAWSFAAELARLRRPARRRPWSTGTARSWRRSACRRPTAPDRWPQLLAAMRRDKKSRGTLLRFVVLDDSAVRCGSRARRGLACARP